MYTSHLKKSSKYLIFTIHISTGNDATVLKLAKKAHQFVKERDGALLTAFETNDLDYVNFRIFLKRLLLLEFTDEEFTKVCYFFDRDGNGAVDGSEFLVGFQLLKNVSVQKERASFFKAKKEREDKEEGKRREKEKQDELHKESAIDFDYTEEGNLGDVSIIFFNIN